MFTFKKNTAQQTFPDLLVVISCSGKIPVISKKRRIRHKRNNTGLKENTTSELYFYFFLRSTLQLQNWTSNFIQWFNNPHRCGISAHISITYILKMGHTWPLWNQTSPLPQRSCWSNKIGKIFYKKRNTLPAKIL